jgi:hypothetical protein
MSGSPVTYQGRKEGKGAREGGRQEGAVEKILPTQIKVYRH